jgi:hypothetical protein
MNSVGRVFDFVNNHKFVFIKFFWNHRSVGFCFQSQ